MKKKIICLADRLLWMILLCGGLFSACRSEKEDPVEKEPEVPATPYITKVLEFVSCPGQFVNVLPEFKEGDTQETMNQKVLELIGNNKRGLVSLGGFGGYVVVGFDHTIETSRAAGIFGCWAMPSTAILRRLPAVRLKEEVMSPV